LRDAATTEGLVKRAAVWVIVFLCIVSCSACSKKRRLEPVIEFKKESVLLDTIPATVSPRELQLSPDGSEVAYRWKTPDGRQGFAVNGRIERYFDEIGEFLQYTRDGTHYAYRAKKAFKDLIVFDGTDGEAYDQVTDPVLSITGHSVAYAAKKGDQAYVIFNDKEGRKDYDLVGPPILSPDGKRVAYPAKQGGKWFYVVDGSEGKPYDEVGYGYFSGDAKNFAYEARRTWKWVIVIDGKESPEYDEVGLYPETPDSAVFTAKNSKKECAVVRGEPGPEYEHVGWPAVSGNGKHIAYDAQRNGRGLVVVDGREGKTYDSVGRPVFSPDGKEVAYDVVDGKQFFMVRNDRELRDFVALPNPVFNPGGKLAYSALTHDASKQFVVEEGAKGKEYDKMGLLVWSRDGRHLAYSAREGDKEFLVVDGKEGKPYDRILNLAPRFSGDGKFVGANAMKGQEVWWIVEPAE
jgi:hypothetical protein